VKGPRWTTGVPGDGRSSALVVGSFALAGLAVVALLGVIAFAVFKQEGREAAIGEAKRITRIVGQGVVEPHLGRPVIAGDRAAIANLDSIVHREVLSQGVVRVKVWDAGGRIVYSDASELVGRRFPLDGEERQVLLSNAGVVADVSDLEEPEQASERALHEGRLLEVYVPLRAADGQRLLFESYLPYSLVSEGTDRLVRAFMPWLVAALLLLWFAQLPLAVSMGRRLRERQREREVLLQRAIESSDLERRRIARDLHDGAVQNLVAVAYALGAERPDDDEDEEGGGDGTGTLTISRPAAVVRETIRELRTLLVDIYPPNLHQSGLRAALEDVVAPLETSGMTVELDVPHDLVLPTAAEALLFRVAQEAIRNAHRHSGAEHVEVRVWTGDGWARLTVRDDGEGFIVGDLLERMREGHLGLRLVASLAHESGGRVDVESSRGEGTSVTVEVPLS
jgi:two-component system, NarL family, sensor kinase